MERRNVRACTMDKNALEQTIRNNSCHFRLWLFLFELGAKHGRYLPPVGLRGSEGEHYQSLWLKWKSGHEASWQRSHTCRNIESLIKIWITFIVIAGWHQFYNYFGLAKKRAEMNCCWVWKELTTFIVVTSEMPRAPQWTDCSVPFHRVVCWSRNWWARFPRAPGAYYSWVNNL